MALVLLVPPAGPCVSLAEAKSALSVSFSDDDDLISALIGAGQSYLDTMLGRQIMPAAWRLVIDGFPRAARLRLPRPPLIELTSIAYRDVSGVWRNMALDDVDLVPGGDQASFIMPIFGNCWPATDCRPGAVQIEYRAGYEPPETSPAPDAAAAVPQAIKRALLLLVGHWYANREASSIGAAITDIPMGVDALLTPYRAWGSDGGKSRRLDRAGGLRCAIIRR